MWQRGRCAQGRIAWSALVLALGLACGRGWAQAPAITAVRVEGAEIVVAASVPAGTLRAALEFSARLPDGGWAPLAVAHLDGAGGEVIFRVAVQEGQPIGYLRVVASSEEPLPAEFFTGASSFLGEPGSPAAPGWGPGREGDWMGGVVPTDAGGGTREVVESDIWRLAGDRLYFFNQYRGLQVIDVADPDAPALLAVLPLAWGGEQMYVLPSGHAVLLARENQCGGSTDESAVLVVAVDGAAAEVVARLPVPGWIQESRMVGSALYVASNAYRPLTSEPGSEWESGTVVSSFDLADPAHPQARDQFWYPGYGNVVTATEEWLLVGVNTYDRWYHSAIHFIDIADATGLMADAGVVPVSGHVADKFKLQIAAGVFCVVAQSWNDATRWETTLQTFRIDYDPGQGVAFAARPLATLNLEKAAGEQLHATRFAGDLVYIVTFFQVDPLWIVDISDPARPVVAGELEVPGWSTYIQPLPGDRLLAVGVDDTEGWKVAVSLFNVAEPAAPSLLSKVLIGDGWSWSEANDDEKAFGVLLDAGLALVPFTSSGEAGGMQGVQLIDLVDPDGDQVIDGLAARGAIEHGFQARRATMHADRVLSISARELLSVDVADRDNPVITARLELTWSVDQVLLAGDYVLELEKQSWSWGGAAAGGVLRVARADAPNEILAQADLGPLPVVGAAVRAGRLYVVQSEQNYWWWAPAVDAEGDEAPKTAPLVLSIFDLAQLPELPAPSSATFDVALPALGSGVQMLWPAEGVLVLAGGGVSGPIWWWGGPIALDAPMAAGGASRGLMPWYWSSGGGRLLAFDVGDPAAPVLLSDTNLEDPEEGRWFGSDAFTAGGAVYLSHQTSVFVEGLVPGGGATGSGSVDPGAAAGTVEGEEGGDSGESDPGTGSDPGDDPVPPEPVGTWVQRWYLDLVDYSADPAAPVVRDPVNIPGALEGVSHGGALLYTRRQAWDPATNIYGPELLEASAYDGVQAHLVAGLSLPESWPHPSVVGSGVVFLGRPSEPAGGGGTSPTLEAWALSDARAFELLDTAELGAPASTLGLFGGLLAAGTTDGAVELLDVSDPAALEPVGKGRTAACYWYDFGGADGDLARGLWVPLGYAGVAFIPAAAD